MPDLADGSRDLVFFSFNGLDALDHSDRLAALAEIHRVLATSGHFVFSAHNRQTSFDPAWRRRDLSWRRGDVMASLTVAAQGLASHLRLRYGQRRTAEYALINDRAHNHRMLVYYITPAAQERQLVAAGFTAPTVIDLAGSVLPQAETATDPWLYYVCRKRDGG